MLSIRATEFACFKSASIFSASVFSSSSSWRNKKNISVSLERWTWRRCATTDSLFLTKLASVVACSPRSNWNAWRAHTHMDARSFGTYMCYCVFVCDACVWHMTSMWRRRLTIVLWLNCASANGTQREKPVCSLKSWNAQQIHCRTRTGSSTMSATCVGVSVCVRAHYFVVALLLSFRSNRV